MGVIELLCTLIVMVTWLYAFLKTQNWTPNKFIILNVNLEIILKVHQSVNFFTFTYPFLKSTSIFLKAEYKWDSCIFQYLSIYQRSLLLKRILVYILLWNKPSASDTQCYLCKPEFWTLSSPSLRVRWLCNSDDPPGQSSLLKF